MVVGNRVGRETSLFQTEGSHRVLYTDQKGTEKLHPKEPVLNAWVQATILNLFFSEEASSCRRPALATLGLSLGRATEN